MTTLHGRNQNAGLEACGLTLDYSHNLINTEIFDQLIDRCEELQIREQLQDMFAGKPVNITEQRPALHTALRDSKTQPLILNGSNVKDLIREARLQAESLVQNLDQKKVTDLVHLGLGGSYWGPLFAYQALSHLPSKMLVHFVATLDPTELETTLAGLNPQTTHFILASKSFTTQEMLLNAQRAKQWLIKAGIADYESHFMAITENQDAALSWGISAERILPIWIWVGGRFSVWSLMSLPIILAYGFEVFDALLSGGQVMDQHVLTAPWEKNMPALLALIDYWNRRHYQLNTQAIIPYEYALRSLIPHLQQLHMESLGKPGNGPTGSIVWGALGTHAQHTFNQLLQQGTVIVPIDFILSKQAIETTPELADHCFAQRESLMRGHKSSNPHAVLEGNRPSNLILLESLSPENIGALLALYEHKVEILALLYGVNAFDQFGVEHSKLMALTSPQPSWSPPKSTQ